MKKLYCNEYTGEPFTTEEACAESEKKYLAEQEAKKRAEEERLAAQKKKESERAIRAKEVEEAMNNAREAQKKYREVLRAFCKDYGNFHYTVDPKDFFDFVEDLMF